MSQPQTPHEQMIRGVPAVALLRDLEHRFQADCSCIAVNAIRVSLTASSMPMSAEFAALGYDVAVEESSSHGRLDMAVRTAGHVYLFEFKVAEMAPPGSALAQLQERRYADKVPRHRRAHPPHRRRVQPRHPQPHRLRDSRRLTAATVRRDAPVSRRRGARAKRRPWRNP